jgi:hypothetical protein
MKNHTEDARYRVLHPRTIHLIGEINRACRASGISVTGFGRRAVGDPRLHSDLMNGRNPKPRTVQRVKRFIAKLWRA